MKRYASRVLLVPVVPNDEGYFLTLMDSVRESPAVYNTAEEVSFRPSDLPKLPRPEQLLMAEPTYYNVEYVINPHMSENVGRVNRERARRQWESVRSAYERLGLDIEILHGQPNLPDLVFTANQTLPYLREDGSRGIVKGRMQAPQRQGEVAYFVEFFRKRGYHIHEIPSIHEGYFEGMGDALWHVDRRLLWGGYGFRTTRDMYRHLATYLEVPIVLLRLRDPEFYHLDTCLSILTEHQAIAYPEAFDAKGWALLNQLFERVIQPPDREARELMACNAHCPDGKHVLIQRGCSETVKLLSQEGFVPVELNTGEFVKSGGSVFCLKMAYW